jgi:hypothetical protein
MKIFMTSSRPKHLINDRKYSMKVKKRDLIAAFVTAGALLSASPAFAAGAILDVSDGTLVAKGAGVRVSSSFVCSAGEFYTLDIGLAQRVSRGEVTGGNNQTSGDCTGDFQTVSFIINPSSDNGKATAYKNGTAVANVNLFTCTPQFNCENTTFQEEIRIQNK